MITPGNLKIVFPACRNPGVWCRAIGNMQEEFDITDGPRLLMFLAQCGYESEQFNVTRELMSYRTVAQLRAVYPRELPTDDIAQRYVMNPAGLANFVYANRLGNGGPESGDGFKYRGGGLIELTGRANYKAVGEALGLDLELRPSQIIVEPVAARTAGFFWKQNDLNAAADHGDFDYTTRKINGPGMLGHADRRALYDKLVAVTGAPTPVQAAQAVRQATPVPSDGIMTPDGPRDLARQLSDQINAGLNDKAT